MLCGFDGLGSRELSALELAVSRRRESMAMALAWYNSPAYQDAFMNRVKGSDHRVFIIEG